MIKYFALDDCVRKVQASLSDESFYAVLLLCNSEGITYYDYPSNGCAIWAFCVMEEKRIYGK